MTVQSELEERFAEIWSRLYPTLALYSQFPDPKKAEQVRLIQSWNDFAEMRVRTKQRKRKVLFRADFAYVDNLTLPRTKVMIEVQGGIFSRGRHSRGSGQEQDMKKFNLAQTDGWQVFLLSSNMIGDPFWIDCIARACMSLERKAA